MAAASSVVGALARTGARTGPFVLTAAGLVVVGMVLHAGGPRPARSGGPVRLRPVARPAVDRRRRHRQEGALDAVALDALAEMDDGDRR